MLTLANRPAELLQVFIKYAVFLTFLCINSLKNTFNKLCPPIILSAFSTTPIMIQEASQTH